MDSTNFILYLFGQTVIIILSLKSFLSSPISPTPQNMQTSTLIMHPENGRLLILRLAAAVLLRYEPRYEQRHRIPIPRKSMAIVSKANGVIIHLAEMAHDYGYQAFHESVSTGVNLNTDPRMRMLTSFSYFIMLLASSLAREQHPELERANLFITREGEIYSTPTSTKWTAPPEHPVSTWASELVKIFDGTSKIPTKIPQLHLVQEPEWFKVIPNDLRVLQLDTLMKQIFTQMNLDADTTDGEGHPELAELGAQAHACMMVFMVELLLNTGQVPTNTADASLGVEDGYITGRLMEEVEVVEEVKETETPLIIR